ncbi:hypothetical protein [Flavobacterium sp. UBA7682]|uniref:hypothetical protein n=1 Tax=Flavobacterium sp. UBA7682 TaxID=1946560 RepID=UPI0025BA1B2D|nr:hypothetical protein [Flavobacterium sp. UBA7682]
MSIEYVRFRVDEKLRSDFIKTIKQACIILEEFGETLDVEFSQNTDDASLFTWRVVWPSKEVHLEQFRNDRLYHDFHQLVEPYLFLILEMNHYNRI